MKDGLFVARALVGQKVGRRAVSKSQNVSSMSNDKRKSEKKNIEDIKDSDRIEEEKGKMGKTFNLGTYD